MCNAMAVPKIDSYRFGAIVINGRRHSQDVIIYPDRVHGNWWRKTGHCLAPEDLREVFQDPPEVLVVGQGSAALMKVPAETRRKLELARVEVIAEPTAEKTAGQHSPTSASGTSVSPGARGAPKVAVTPV